VRAHGSLFQQSGERHKVIQVTSHNRETATTLSANLAVSIAQSGRKRCSWTVTSAGLGVHVVRIESQVGMSSVIDVKLKSSTRWYRRLWKTFGCCPAVLAGEPVGAAYLARFESCSTCFASNTTTSSSIPHRRSW